MGASWTLDALAYVEVCRNARVPAVLERSRSGDGAHVWVFFSGNVAAAAATARMLGAGVLRAAMELRAESAIVVSVERVSRQSPPLLRQADRQRANGRCIELRGHEKPPFC